MQLNLKLLAGALVLGCLGVWGMNQRAAEPSALPQVSPSSVDSVAQSFDATEGGLADLEPVSDALAPAGGVESTRVDALGDEESRPLGVTLRGRVVNASGGPVFEARLALGDGVSTLTDSGGAYALADLEANTYEVTVEAAGYLPLKARLTLPDAREHELRDLTLLEGRAVEGYVTNHEGAGISRAQIFVVEQPDPIEAVQLRLLATTAADGSFLLAALPRRTCRLGVVAPGFAPRLLDLPAGSMGQPLHWELEPGWSTRVSVKGLEQARAELRISVLPGGSSSVTGDEAMWLLHTQRRWALKPASSAELTVDGLLPGEPYYFQLEELQPNGEWRSCAEVATVGAGEERVELVYQARALVTVAARDAESGKPIEDLSVYAGYWSKAPVSMGEGTFAVDPMIELDLRIEAPGYASAKLPKFTCEPGERRRLAPIELVPIRRLSVDVRDATTNLPVAGASLRSQESRNFVRWRPPILTDARGRATVDALSMLRVEHPGYCGQRLSVADAPDPWVIKLEPGVEVEVRVMDPQGTAVPGVFVACNPAIPADQELPKLESDVEGRVVFRGLAAGDYEFAAVVRDVVGLRVVSGGAAAYSMTVDDDASTAAVAATVGGANHQVVELLVPKRISLTGLVTEASVPAPAVELHVIERAMDLRTVTTLIDLGHSPVSSDASGRFRFPSVQAGPITLVAVHPDQRFPALIQLELHESKDDLEIELPTATLAGTVRDSGGSPLSNAVVWVEVAGLDGSYRRPAMMTMRDTAGIISTHGFGPLGRPFLTDQDGRYAVLHVPVSHVLRVAASAPYGLMERQEIELSPGQHETLDFLLSAAGQIEVEVRVSDGSAPRNAKVTLEWKGQAPGPKAQMQYLGLASSYVFEGLVPGTWEVGASLAESEGKVTNETLEVRANETTRTTLSVNR